MSYKRAIIIDGPSFYSTMKRVVQGEADFKKILAYFGSEGEFEKDFGGKIGNSYVFRAYYYTTVAASEEEYSSMKPLTDWLDYNGYEVYLKSARTAVSQSGQKYIVDNINVEIAVKAMEIADKVDEIVIFTSNGDFVELTEALKNKGVRVVIVSAIQSRSSENRRYMVNDELRRSADIFVDIAKILEKIKKERRDDTYHTSHSGYRHDDEGEEPEDEYVDELAMTPRRVTRREEDGIEEPTAGLQRVLNAS